MHSLGSSARRCSRATSGSAGLGTALLTTVIFFVGSGALAYLRNGGFERDEPVEQPVVFDHRKHVEGEGLQCSVCHPFYEKETFSGLPPPRLCALCHLEPQGESAEEERLVSMLEEGAPLEWQPLFRQPPHVFFSHRRHVAVAGLGCPTCHGDIGTSEAPPTQRAPLSMDRCVGCHEDENASTDCSACHR